MTPAYLAACTLPTLRAMEAQARRYATAYAAQAGQWEALAAGDDRGYLARNAGHMWGRHVALALEAADVREAIEARVEVRGYFNGLRVGQAVPAEPAAEECPWDDEGWAAYQVEESAARERGER